MRELVTPEGVMLNVRLADVGVRLAAFLIDFTIIMATLIFATWVIFAANLDDSGSMATVLWMLVFFFLRSFYFMFFEMRPKAATPGKRLCKIRVAARGKARLTANAVFARNAIREIEFFLPLSYMIGAVAGIDEGQSILGLIWGLVFLLFPLFNKDRLRAGDLIAGTWVVNAPRPLLVTDLADEPGKTAAEMQFTPEQLAMYGVRELHVLEDVIRQNKAATVADVSDRIRKKIGWTGGASEDDLEFLKTYYASLRGQLETKLLFGVRKKDKHDHI
jgi:uncharacterized RDD family membrane protein YckC